MQGSFQSPAPERTTARPCRERGLLVPGHRRPHSRRYRGSRVGVVMFRQTSEARAPRRHPWRLAVLCLVLLPAAAHGTAYRIATGRYSGDGAPLRSITGLGFQPDLVLVKGDL